ncbi:hypothetical protein Aduo_014763 [Ancylostoma duodenale]
MITISPKIWNILGNRSATITEFIKSIRIPETAKNDTMLDYKVWDIKLEDLWIPQDGVYFQDMDNGIHLLVTGLMFHASTKVNVAVGLASFKTAVEGEVRVNCDYAELDLKLEWDGFKMKPVVSLGADLEVVNQRQSAGNNCRPCRQRSESDAAEIEGGDYWHGIISVRRRVDGSKWNSPYSREAAKCNGRNPVKPIDKMVCISSGLLAAVRELKRSKREAVSSDPVESKLGIELSCTPPEGECAISSCSYCLDFDINPSTTRSGAAADLASCVPSNL